MTKNFSKKFASFAVAAVMTVGAAGLASNVKLPAKAFAETGTATQYSVKASEGTINGIGYAGKATVNLNSEAPATLKLSNVSAGQYIFTARLTNEVDEWWIDLVAQVTDSMYPTYLSYNGATGLYTGVITVAADSTIQLSTYALSTLEVEVYLEKLYIGESNDNYLSGVELPAEITVNNAGSYVLNVNIDYNEELDDKKEIPTIKVQVGEEEAFDLTRDDYGNYTGKITTVEGSMLKLTTNASVTITVSVSLSAIISVDDPLPTTAVTFGMYETHSYYYDAVGTGYYSLNWTSTNEDDMFGITMKADPNDFEGTYIEGKNFPLYLVEGDRYYFDITYMSNMTYTAFETSAMFTVDAWEATALQVNQNALYVPVTVEDETKPIALDAADGNYTLSLLNIPASVLYGDVTITAHIKSEKVETKVELENGYAEVTLNNATEIWFTSDYDSNFVAGAVLNTIQENTTIVLGETESLELTGNETQTYSIEILKTGYYEVVLDIIGGQPVEVSASTAARPIIPYGNTHGAFFFEVSENDSTAYLYFSHTGTGTTYFDVIVNPVDEDITMKLNQATEITVDANSEKTYFIENIEEGVYSVELTLPEGVEIQVDSSAMDSAIILEGKTEGTFVVYYMQTVSLIFKNNGSSAATFSAKVTRVAEGYMYLGWENYISMSATDNTKTYLLEDLDAGTYAVNLDLPEGVEIQVTMGGETIIASGHVSGSFTVAANGTNVALTFTYMGTSSIDFTAIVHQIA